MTPEAYPLHWPVGWPRTKHYARHDSRFGRNITFARSLDDLNLELDRFSARNVVLSTDVPVRIDGLPFTRHAQPNDPGAAVYFIRRDEPLVIACDSYLRTWENVRAIAKTVEAMRAISRHGASQLLERAVSGFKQLGEGEVADDTPPPEPWWEVFAIGDAGIGVDQLKTIIARPDHMMRGPLLKMIEAIFREKIRDAHPDTGGTAEETARLAGAIERARTDLGRVSDKHPPKTKDAP